ncbi:formylglycine-generating enzyme family protein [Aquabacterium lacunae]|uniref:Formylglycine-generating enzyme family protein n=1 Tax=Aquabacterium lacunae TaxID=2528630 RepID=A0A4Q9H342_9BURK|nr:formylglycine-generating enzyme family protein [Aquabacterium lacunae]
MHTLIHDRLPACGAGRLACALVSLVALQAGAQPPDGPVPPPEPIVTNRLGMQMVRLPAGEFTMGNPASVDDMARWFPGLPRERLLDLKDEQPAHRVRLSSFYMARHEVTVGQWRAFLAASGHLPESVADGTGGYGYDPQHPGVQGKGDAFAGRAPRFSWANPGFAQTDSHPVVNVTWHDAQALAQWLSQQEGRRYRLPTEAEWEYACRAGSSTQFHTGDAPDSLQGSANVFDRDAAEHWPLWREQALPVNDGFAFTAPVGRFTPNAFGLHDLHGNVWEWTADFHADDTYARPGQPAGQTVHNPTGPAEGSVRVRRGGSWHTWPLYARCSYRNWNSATTRYTLVGIRLVMDVAVPQR